MRIAHQYISNEGISVLSHSDFYNSIRKVVNDFKCMRLIETGTHKGTGTTTAIIEGMQPRKGTLYTIEVNRSNYEEACKHVKGFNRNVVCMWGLSIPRTKLLNEHELYYMLDQYKNSDIFVDYDESSRIESYMKEISGPCEDDLLTKAFAKCENIPDFILLDSAGHVGYVEFTYVLSKLKAPCIICLDDTRHIKHAASLELAKSMSQFTIIEESTEKFGFAVLRYVP